MTVLAAVLSNTAKMGNNHCVQEGWFNNLLCGTLTHRHYYLLEKEEYGHGKVNHATKHKNQCKIT